MENSDTADTYYYAKRGCTANPEDGVATGDQTQADSFVIPKGYTGIKQTNQRVTTKKANTIQASSASVATIMDCYACSTNMLKTVTGANPAEPTYDSIKTINSLSKTDDFIKNIKSLSKTYDFIKKTINSHNKYT